MADVESGKVKCMPSVVAAAGSAAASVVFAASIGVAFATALRRPASGGYCWNGPYSPSRARIAITTRL